MQELWELLAGIECFDDRVQTVERYLLTIVARAFDRTSIMNAAQYCFEHQLTGRVSELARITGLSLRQFERRFVAEVGFGPNLYARIARYQMALDSKLCAPNRPWLSIAHEAGYHEQMHMIRDFQCLSGASPDRLLAELGDTRPPALAASVQS